MVKSRIFLLVALIFVLTLTACGSGGGDGQPVDVTVDMTDFMFTMSQTEFQTGVTYHFILTNNGAVAHDFIIMPVAEGTQVSSLSAEEKQALALVMVNEDQLQPGATVEIDYTFTSVPEGNIEVVCALPGHFEAGMHHPITIK